MHRPIIQISGNPSFHAPVTVNAYRTQAYGITDRKSVGKMMKPVDDNHGKEEEIKFGNEPASASSSEQVDKFKVHFPKGRVLLVTNELLTRESKSVRHRDVLDMFDLWDSLDCEVTILTDLSDDKLQQRVIEFSKYEGDFRFVVLIIIMSCATKHVLEVDSSPAVDEIAEGGQVETKITRIVQTILQSDNMEGKPKLIFFQLYNEILHTAFQSDTAGICNIEESWITEFLANILDNGRLLGSDNFQTDAAPLGTSMKRSRSRSPKDVMIAIADQSDYVAFRDLPTGSYFLQSVKEIFGRRAAKFDVRDLMEMVKATLERSEITDRGVSMNGVDTFGDQPMKLHSKY